MLYLVFCQNYYVRKSFARRRIIVSGLEAVICWTFSIKSQNVLPAEFFPHMADLTAILQKNIWQHLVNIFGLHIFHNWSALAYTITQLQVKPTGVRDAITPIELAWAACVRCHGTKCPLLTAFFFFFFLSSPAVTFLPEGVIVRFQNFAWGFNSQKK